MERIKKELIISRWFINQSSSSLWEFQLPVSVKETCILESREGGMNTPLGAGRGRGACGVPGAHRECCAHVFILESGPGDGPMVPRLTPLQEVDKTQ